MRNLKIIPFSADHIAQVKAFADKWIGQDYFEREELEEVLALSRKGELVCSLLAVVDGELAAIRLSYAPGEWVERARGASVEKWGEPKSQTGYFKSLFVAEKFQKQGLGKKISLASIEVLREMGAKALVCHSWLESPQNSSQRYLQSMGFEEVKSHPRFWSHIDYSCVRCSPKRCECSAVEMIKYLS